MAKNVTPKQIAIICALILGSLFFLIFSAGIVFSFIQTSWLLAFIFGIGISVFSYFLITYILKRFIYRKIKLIYKSIHEFKLATKMGGSKSIDLNQDILEDVEQEVSQWADKQKKEIESLKTLEAYRREFLGNISHELKTPIFSIQGLHTYLAGWRAYMIKRSTKIICEKLQIMLKDYLTIVEDLGIDFQSLSPAS